MVFNLYQKSVQNNFNLASEERSTVNHSVPGTDSTGLSPIEAGFYKKGREKLQGSWFKGKAQLVTTGKITDLIPRENFVQQPRPSHQGSVSDWRTSLQFCHCSPHTWNKSGFARFMFPGRNINQNKEI